MLRILGCLDNFGILTLYRRSGLAEPITITHIVRLAVVLSLIGMVMIVSTFYQWSHVVMLTFICLFTTIVVTQLLFKHEPTQQVSSHHHLMPTLSEQSIPNSIHSYQPHTVTHSFPDTPMPATPLIRVLETIDLSSTNVEHFLDINAQTPPRTETDIDAPSINLPEAFYQRSRQEDCENIQ